MAPDTAPDLPIYLAGDALRTEADGSVRLVGSACGNCGQRVFPPTSVCPECLSDDISPEDLPTEGTLYSWSTVHVAPANWHAPYIAGYVDLTPQVRVFAHIVDVGDVELAMDMPVCLVEAELGREADGTAVVSYAFTPLKS